MAFDRSLPRGIAENETGVSGFYRLVFENASSPVIVVDLAGEILFANPAAAGPHGCDARDMIGRHTGDFFAPDTANNILLRNRRFVEDGEYRVNRERVRLIDGTCRCYETIRVAVPREIHDQPAVMLLADDVTELEATAEELRRSEARYRLVVENSQFTVSVLGRDGVIRFANQRIAQRVGKSPEELIGQPIETIYGEKVAKDARRWVGQTLKTGGPVTYTYVLPTAQGDIHYDVYMQPYPATDPPDSVLVIALDVTELHEVECERRRLAAAVASTVDGIIVVGTDNRIRYANQAFLDQRELRPDQVVGRPVSDLLGGDDPGLSDRIVSRLGAGESWTGIIGARDSRGRQRQWGVSITPIRDEHGQVVDYVGVYRDRRTEQELAERLAQARRLEALGETAGRVAHDFRDLLHMITMQVDAALNGGGSVREHLDNIARITDRGRDLARQILTFSRQDEPERGYVRLHLVVREVVALLRGCIPADIAFETEIDEDVGGVIANETQIHQVVVNLCRNASDALRHADHGTLHVALQRRERDGAAFACLEVSDDGEGMDEATRQRLFEPYFSGRRGEGGTGLGLAVVHGIVTALGGTVEVDSAPGEGANFRVYLPVAADPSFRGSASRVDVHRVLVLSTDEQMRDLLRLVLGDVGCHGVCVSDGDELVDTFAADPREYDLVVIDVGTAGPDLVELGRRLWQHRPQAPILVLASPGLLSPVERQRVVTFCRIVEKPLRVADLERAFGFCLAAR